MTHLDYLPCNSFEDSASYSVARFEMNENFIVALDPDTNQLKYWSRRTLLPLKIEPVSSNLAKILSFASNNCNNFPIRCIQLALE